MSKAHKTRLLNQVRETWQHHHDWTLGRLLQSANDIALGEFRTNPAYAKDGHLIIGLKALIPDDEEETK